MANILRNAQIETRKLDSIARERFKEGTIKPEALKPFKNKKTGKVCDDIDYALMAMEIFEAKDKENSSKFLPTDYGVDNEVVEVCKVIKKAVQEGVPRKDIHKWLATSVLKF